MGQYYKPCSLDRMEALYSHDYGSGLKMMEHSYIGNNFVGAVEQMLTRNGRWHKNRFVWAGDYMPSGKFLDKTLPDGTELVGDANVYSMAKDIKPKGHKSERTFSYPTKEVACKMPKKGRYLVNHTKQVSIDMSQYKPSNPESDIWSIHPLPLLTSCGNGQGGGDYSGSNMELVGSWAGDVISYENEPTYELISPPRFKEGR